MPIFFRNDHDRYMMFYLNRTHRFVRATWGGVLNVELIYYGYGAFYGCYTGLFKRGARDGSVALLLPSVPDTRYLFAIYKCPKWLEIRNAAPELRNFEECYVGFFIYLYARIADGVWGILCFTYTPEYRIDHVSQRARWPKNGATLARLFNLQIING